MTKPICKVDSLGFAYSNGATGKQVLEGVGFELRGKEILGFLGESGVGKSTLLSIVAGELRAVKGSVDTDAHVGGKIAFCRQFDTLVPFRNLKENVRLLAERGQDANMGLVSDPLAMLTEVGLSDRSSDYPDALSGGMRQRVQLAQCLTSSPALMLLDEPFSQQDLITQIKLEELVSRIVKTSNGAALVVSHDLGALAAVCDRVISLGGQPASIHSSLVIEGELGGLSPQQRRNSKDYATLLTKLWDMRLAASEC